MDEEDDIPTKGTPGENGYDPAGEAPFAGPEEEAEDDTTSKEGDAESLDDEPDLGDLDSIQGTLEALEQDESPQPVGSEGGDPKLAISTPAVGDSPPPFAIPSRGETTKGIGFSKDVPADLPVPETPAEEAAPDLDDLDETQETLESFGEQLNAFNEAGGADSIGGGGSDSGGGQEASEQGGEDNGLRNFAEANVNNATTQYEFLMDHARALNDLARRLEIERQI